MLQPSWCAFVVGSLLPSVTPKLFHSTNKPIWYLMASSRHTTAAQRFACGHRKQRRVSSAVTRALLKATLRRGQHYFNLVPCLFPKYFCRGPRIVPVKMCTLSSRWQWLHESETIVIVEHSLMFCAPPNTGSLQFRMLAKRIKVGFSLSV